MILVQGGGQGVPVGGQAWLHGDQGHNIFVPNPALHFLANHQLLQQHWCQVHLIGEVRSRQQYSALSTIFGDHLNISPLLGHSGHHATYIGPKFEMLICLFPPSQGFHGVKNQGESESIFGLVAIDHLALDSLTKEEKLFWKVDLFQTKLRLGSPSFHLAPQLDEKALSTDLDNYTLGNRPRQSFGPSADDGELVVDQDRFGRELEPVVGRVKSKYSALDFVTRQVLQLWLAQYHITQEQTWDECSQHWTKTDNKPSLAELLHRGCHFLANLKLLHVLDPTHQRLLKAAHGHS